MAYLIQTTKGIISLDAPSFESAQSTAVDLLGYELVQPKVDLEKREVDADNLGNCHCGAPATKILLYYGRKIVYCDSHYEFESAKLNKHGIDNASAETNIPYKIEQVVKGNCNFTVENARDIYNTERTQWLVSNFKSAQEMRDSLIQFISSIENLVFEKKNKLRAAYDAARELDASLSKTERDALINDPSFKTPENKEFKDKIKKGNKEERAIASLIALGMSREQAITMVGKK